MSSSPADENRFSFLDEDSNIIINGEALSQGVATYYHCDPTAQRSFDLKTIDGASCYLSWLAANNARMQGLELERFFSRRPKLRDLLKHEIQMGAFRIPAVFVAFWKYDGDLHPIDLTTSAGLSTLVSVLMDRYSSLRANAGLFDSFLGQPVDESGLPLALLAIHTGRPQYANFIDIKNEKGRAALLGQAIIDRELDLYPCPSLKSYLAATSSISQNSRAAHALWDVRWDLKCAFGKEQVEAPDKLEDWFAEHARNEFPVLARILDSSSSSGQDEASFRYESSAYRFANDLRDGVNLVGFPFSISGIGADLRMLASVLEKIGCDYGVLETPHESPSDKQPSFSAARVLDVPHFDKTVFCLPCSEIFRYVAFYPRAFFRDQILVGMMPWELPEWPKEQVIVLKLFDEIWCITEFIQRALEKVAPCPVRLVHRYIESHRESVFGRDHFGLKQQAFTYLFIFDSLSSLSRKNPRGLIEAFRRAFGASDKRVQLVLKTMKSSYDKSALELADEISKSSNITLIDRTLTDDELSGLVQSTDCYVSLHRAEGFGLTIADAMLAEKPVIVSNYSGNLDFCTPETAYLVDGRLIPVLPGQYFYTENQVWFDPDLDRAAQALRACHANRDESATIAQSGKRLILEKYGLESATRSFGTRLKELEAKS